MSITELIILLLIFKVNFSKGQLYKPKVPIICNQNQHCPKKFPCCSPYGECGTGPSCIGGCQPFYSNSMKDCIPHKLQTKPISLVGSQVTITEYYKYLITNDGDAAKNQLRNVDLIYSGHLLHKGNDDLWLTMPKRTTGALVATPWEFLYGKVEVKMKIAKGKGVITAIVLISQTGDEIDLEFIGGETHWVQTNYFSQGQLEYTRMIPYPLLGDASESYYTFGIDWNQDRMQWFINDKLVRTVYKIDTWDNGSKRYKYPCTPVRVEVAVWPGGDENNHPGTIEWAGGKVEWDNDPTVVKDGFFHAQINQIQVLPQYSQLHGSCPYLFYRYLTSSDWETKCSTMFYHNGTDGVSIPITD